MLNLENVTILSVDCVNPNGALRSIEYSCNNINFKERILLTDSDIKHDNINVIKIDKLNTVDEYSDFMLTINKYVDSDYVLIVQNDGFVVNHNCWSDIFFKYDYIGAAWSNEVSWIEKQTAKKYMTENFNRVGNGGFSLRSKRFLKYSSKFKSCFGFNEDNFLCIIQ